MQTVVPANPLESAARSTPDMIAVMFFALMFGIALTLVKREAAQPVIDVVNGVFEVVAKIVAIVLKLAPYGVAALLFAMTARFGFGFLVGLGWFVGTVLLGLALHMFVVYSAALKFVARVSPLEFFRRTKTVALTAFSTSSSNATPANRAAGLRSEPRRTEGHRVVRADDRRDGQSKRDRALRGRHRAVSCTTCRLRSLNRSAVDRAVSGDPGRHRNGRCAVWIDPLCALPSCTRLASTHR